MDILKLLGRIPWIGKSIMETRQGGLGVDAATWDGLKDQVFVTDRLAFWFTGEGENKRIHIGQVRKP